MATIHCLNRSATFAQTLPGKSNFNFDIDKSIFCFHFLIGGSNQDQCFISEAGDSRATLRWGQKTDQAMMTGHKCNGENAKARP